MAITISHEGRGPVILVSGVFDADAAARLGTVLSAPRPASSVVIDFSRARDIPDTALAALLDTMRESGVELRARGLSERHHRMLKLLSAVA